MPLSRTVSVTAVGVAAQRRPRPGRPAGELHGVVEQAADAAAQLEGMALDGAASPSRPGRSRRRGARTAARPRSIASVVSSARSSVAVPIGSRRVGQARQQGQVLGQRGEPGGVADHRHHGAARVLGQVHAPRAARGGPATRASGFCSSRATVSISLRRKSSSSRSSVSGRALALAGPRVEDRPAEVVGDLERGRALVVGPARGVGVAVHGQQPEELGAGADGHQHDLAQTARVDVRRQLVAEVLVEVVVAPDVVAVDDQDRLPRPTRGPSPTSWPRAASLEPRAPRPGDGAQRRDLEGVELVDGVDPQRLAPGTARDTGCARCGTARAGRRAVTPSG